MTTRILLVDGRTLLREGLRSLFLGQHDMEIVAEATDGSEAVALARESRPDVVIIDVVLTALNGIDATRAIIGHIPRARVIVLTSSRSKLHVRQMFEAGACAYVLLESSFTELQQAIEDALADRPYVSPEIGGLCVRDWIGTEKGDASPPSALTPREREVLQLLAEGMSSKQIASRQHVSVRTIEAQRRSIGEILNLSSIAELTKYAVREGLTPLD